MSVRRESAELKRSDSPTSPMPTSTTSTEGFYAPAGSSPTLPRDNGKPIELPRRLLELPNIPDDDLDDAISRLSVSETTGTLAENQIRTKSQETARRRPPHHIRGVDDIIRHQALEQAAGDTDGHGQHQRHFDSQESEWEPQDEEEAKQHESKARGEPQACLFVASLAASRTDVQLMESVTDHFKKWGPLMNVKVLKDWMQRPYSFVQFERIEDAQRAMAEAQNTVIDGRHIRIEQARVNRTLFILRFGRNTTEQDITDVLEQYGPVEDVSIFHDLGPARNKRYAFAKFAYRDDAIRAYMALRSSSKWTVEWAPNLSSQTQIEKESVFVGQLNPESTTEAALHDRFQDYGNIQHIHLVKRSKPGTSRLTAFAFIEFDNEHSARRAIEHENNTSFLGTTIRVQHREASEYRLQRQNTAIQAARNLNMPHAGGPPPIGMTAPVHTAEYNGLYPPYRGPGIGRPMYYTTYYTYPTPMAGGYISRPQPGTMFVQPSATTRGSPSTLDGNQGYYPGATSYGSQALQNNAAEQYGATPEAGAGHQGYDYGTYVHSPEGMYYRPPVPARVYMYDQASSVAAVTPMVPGTAPVAPAAHTTSTVSHNNPMWYSPSRPTCGPPARTGSEALNPHGHYMLPSQRRPSDVTPSTASSSSPSHDVHSQTHKTI